MSDDESNTLNAGGASVPSVTGPTRYTVRDNMVACGISDERQQNAGSSPAERIAKEVFNDSFEQYFVQSDLN